MKGLDPATWKPVTFVEEHKSYSEIIRDKITGAVYHGVTVSWH